jgi:hypothetical protein
LNLQSNEDETETTGSTSISVIFHHGNTSILVLKKTTLMKTTGTLGLAPLSGVLMSIFSQEAFTFYVYTAVWLCDFETPEQIMISFVVLCCTQRKYIYFLSVTLYWLSHSLYELSHVKLKYTVSG